MTDLIRLLSFAGKRVAVTGGASGLGAAMASAFAAQGATVLLADRSEAALAAQAAAIGAGATWHVYDQGDTASCEALAARLGRLDVLVNCAGMLIKKPLLDYGPADIQRVIDVDLVGAMALTRPVAAAMVKAGKGVIVNIASQMAFCGAAERGAYAAAKAGLVQYTKTAAAEWGRHGVRVVAIAPGRINTPMTAAALADPAEYAEGLKHIPIGRYGEPADIAHAALYLASDAASYVTGATLLVDGGFVVV
ncbi:MAG: SDR family oxidoreductase [Alphaproteobacteria bacterium]|nr:SDR family oxidoreductase [Alphaproteobacteria bacterium]